MSLQDSPAALCINVYSNKSVQLSDTQPKPGLLSQRVHFLASQRRTFCIKQGICSLPFDFLSLLFPIRSLCVGLVFFLKSAEWAVETKHSLEMKNYMKWVLTVLILSLGQQFSPFHIKRLKKENRFIQIAFCPPSTQFTVFLVLHHSI